MSQAGRIGALSTGYSRILPTTPGPQPILLVVQEAFGVDEYLRGTCRRAAHARFVVYEGAPHAFHSDCRASYQPEPAKDGWSRMLD